MADTVIFNNPSMAFVDTGMGLFLWQEMPSTINLTVGETYLVEWNGEQFSCVAVSANLNGVDGIGIGNLALAGVGGNTNEPFLLGVGADGSFSACYTTENKATNQMVISHVAEEDKDYLIKGSTLKAIGNAIREKTGKTEDIPPLDMPGEIRGIAGGGSGGSDVEVVYVAFMNHDGTEELHKRAVLSGNDCMEVVSGGELEMPTKESTAQYNYTFAGWSTAANGGLNENALKNVTEDRTVYAAYISTVRFYTVRFWDGETLLETQLLAYGEIPSYTPDGLFKGWTPELTAVTGDADYYAEWSTISLEDASWETINELATSGTAADCFSVGDTKTFVAGETEYLAQIAGFNHDTLASDESKKAGITFIITGVYPTKTKFCSNSQAYSWENSIVRTTCTDTILPSLPTDLQEVIKPVVKTSRYSSSNLLATVTDSVWIPSRSEVDSSVSAKDRDGDTYPIFTDNASRVNGYAWWLRSKTGDNARLVSTSGLMSYSSAQTSSQYIRFGFCI